MNWPFIFNMFVLLAKLVFMPTFTRQRRASTLSPIVVYLLRHFVSLMSTTGNLRSKTAAQNFVSQFLGCLWVCAFVLGSNILLPLLN